MGAVAILTVVCLSLIVSRIVATSTMRIFSGILPNGHAANNDTLSNEAVDICRVMYDKGPCQAIIPRYFYNPASNKCEKFDFGGCRGNGNNFESVASCEKRCPSKGKHGR